MIGHAGELTILEMFMRADMNSESHRRLVRMQAWSFFLDMGLVGWILVSVSEFSIERMHPDGWERVRAVRLRALADTPDAFGTTLAESEAMPVERWRERLEAEADATFLASDRAGDIGLVVGRPWEFSEDPGAVGLFAMWVAPEARGRGVGGALVDAVVDWAKHSGYARVFLDVADQNAPALALYESKGFVPTGKTATLPEPRQHVLEHERVLVLV